MKLSALWSDGMVLQRGEKIILSGKADGNHVTAVIDKKVYETAAEADGSFTLIMDEMEAGGPYELELYDAEKTIISDIWIGDVWILGGQSNMELPVKRTLDVTESEIMNENFPNVRYFQVPLEYDFSGERSFIDSGVWLKADRRNVLEFSATGYFFSAELAESCSVPVGLIKTAVGGTPVEAWMSRKTLENMGICREALERNQNSDYVKKVSETDARRISDWYERLNRNDRGYDPACPWYTLSFDEADKILDFDGEINVPGMWKGTELEDYKGSVWFCISVDVPDTWCDEELLLRVGTIIDADEVYVNGILVGHTAYRYPPRKYAAAPGIFCRGRNTIWVRVISDQNPGGFMPGKPFRVERPADKKSVRFDGRWKYIKGSPMERLMPPVFFQYEPSGVFNAMIAPLRNVRAKGVIFYQGESNDNDPKDYGLKFKNMIEDWRRTIGNSRLWFLYVQLAGFGDGKTENTGTVWAELRKEQASCQSIEAAAMVSAIDLGEYNDLHPQNKAVLGRRLADAARALIYGEDIDWKSPEAEKLTIEDSRLTVSVCCTRGGIEGEGELKVIYSNGSFEFYKAVSENGKVVCRNVRTEGIRAVCYGWENYPRGIGFHSNTGLPLLPFYMQYDNF